MDIAHYPTLRDVPWYFRGWVWCVGGLTILMAGLIIGWLMKPQPLVAGLGRPVRSADEIAALVQLQTVANDALRTRLTDLTQALTQNVCKGDGAQTAATAIGLPALPATTPIPAAGASATVKLSRQDLLAKLEAATVLVETADSLGSGFFVGPDTVVTNDHVIDGAKPLSIHVTSTTLKGSFPATVIAHTGQKVGDRDFAILRISGATAPQSLVLTDKVEKLDPVIAAGYPGVYLGVWQGSGGQGIPPLFPRQGDVVYVQNSPAGVRLISHTAQIYHGNSGGPLVDACGRVVGVNTFGYTEPDGKADDPATAVAKVDFAIGANDLIGYLQELHVAVSTAADACQ